MSKFAATLLICLPGHRLAKRYEHPDAEPQPYDAGVLFQAVEVSGDWLDFVETLGSLPSDACLIRGAVHPEAREIVEAGECVRRLAYDREGCDAAFVEALRAWIVLDYDHTDAPFDLGAPDASIRAWHATMPEQIRGARSAFFPSASAHQSPTVRGKLLVALDEPIGNAAAAAFARSVGADPSVSHTVAINYFAAPVFAFGGDPLGECRAPTLFDGEPMHIDASVLDAPSTHTLGARASGNADPLHTDRSVELAGALYARWIEGGRVETNAWLHLAGWLLGKGWPREEIAGLLEALDSDEGDARKVAEHRHILGNARAIEGPGGVREWMGEGLFSDVDALLVDPTVRLMIERREARAAEAFNPIDLDEPLAGNGLVLDTDRQGRPLSTPRNASLWIEAILGERLRFEDCSGRLMVSGCPESWCLPDGAWTDTHTTELQIAMNEARLAIAKDTTHDVAIAHGKRHRHNVLTDHVLQLAAQWDGVPRVDRAMSTYWHTENSAATRAASRVFLLSMAARALEPGCKVDTALLLIGGQGIRKSSSLKALAGASMFSDSPLPIGDKDALQIIRGKWLWEVAENASASRRDRNAVKAFLSASEDTFRASYGRFSETVPRQTCFAISSNDPEPLNDPTGARRYLPVVLSQSIDTDAIERDRDQLIGEAAARVLADEQWWPTSVEDESLDAVRHAVTDIGETTDPWDQAIEAWVEARTEVACAEGMVAERDVDTWAPTTHLAPFGLADLFALGSGAISLPIEQVDRRTQMRACDVLRRMGLRKIRTTRGGRRTYVWG